MRPIVVVLIVVALAIAGVTAFLAKRFLADQAAQQQEVVQPAEPAVTTKRVLVAARDIKAGAVLIEDDFTYHEWPEGAVREKYVVRGEGQDPKVDFLGAIAKRDYMAGEPMTGAGVFRQDQASVLAGMISPGMQAFSIAVTPISGVAGFIGPGDRVDVLLTQRLKVTDEETGDNLVDNFIVTDRILSDVRVLAMDTRTGQDKSAVTSKTATLELSPTDVQRLATARDMGSISLALRSMIANDAADAIRGDAEDYVTAFDVSNTFKRLQNSAAVALFSSEPQERQVEKEEPRVAVSAPPSVEVTLNRGGVSTTRSFVRSGH